MKELLATLALVLCVSQPAFSLELSCARVPDDSQASVFDVNTGELARHLPGFTDFHYTGVRSDGYVVMSDSPGLMIPVSQLVAAQGMNSCKNHYTVETVDPDGYVNVRETPGGDILTTLPNGAEVIGIIGGDRDSAEVLTYEGFFGYINSDFLSRPHYGMNHR